MLEAHIQKRAKRSNLWCACLAAGLVPNQDVPASTAVTPAFGMGASITAAPDLDSDTFDDLLVSCRARNEADATTTSPLYAVSGRTLSLLWMATPGLLSVSGARIAGTVGDRDNDGVSDVVALVAEGGSGGASLVVFSGRFGHELSRSLVHRIVPGILLGLRVSEESATEAVIAATFLDLSSAGSKAARLQCY